jgi:hypothetical protein
MTVKKSDFKGEERGWSPDGGDGSSGDSTEGLLKELAAQQNDPASHGANAEPGAVGDGSGSPRRHGAAQSVPAGNDASTGKAGAWPAGPANQPGPHTTGAGQGSSTVKKYGKGK